MAMMDTATFSRQLAETIAWCEPRVDAYDPKWCLRSDALKPNYDYYSSDEPTIWNDIKIIQSIVDRRQRALAAHETTITSPADLHGGRLLMCYFDKTNHNQCSADESRWFYDGNDNPPWDTWVAPVNDALVSWVPPQLLDLATEGMAVECCQMLMWLEQPLSYILDDKPRQIPDWLKQLSQSVMNPGDAG